MRTRLLALALLAAALLGLAPVAGAQGGQDQGTCFNLPPEDCAILLAATAHTQANLRAFHLAFTLDLALSGTAALRPLAGPGLQDLSAHLEAEGLVAAAEPAVYPPVEAQLALSGNVSSGAQRQPLSAHLVLAEGVLYRREGETGPWLGTPVAELLDSLDPQTRALVGLLLGPQLETTAALPEGTLTPGDLLGGDSTALLEGLDAGQGFDMEALLQTPGFINHERLPDETDGGQTMHVFRLTLDTAPLFASPEFQDMLGQMVATAAEDTPGMGTQMARAVPMLLSGISITFQQTQWVGAQDRFIHATAISLNATIDLGAMVPSGSGSGGARPSPIILDLHATADLDRLNETFSIAAPPGATMVPAAAFLP